MALPTVFRHPTLTRVATTIALGATFGLVAAVCTWTHLCFKGAGACTTTNCGYLCFIDEYGNEQGKCYTSGSAQCCLCWFRVDRCDCIVSPDHWRREAARIQVNWTVCDSGSCGTSCPGYTPPPLPT
jgi:hypothetical protein